MSNNNEVLKKQGLDRLAGRLMNYIDKTKLSKKGGKVSGNLHIDGQLEVDQNISSLGGVSASGIADFGTPSGAGGAVGIDVLRDDELESLQAESITQVASAYAVSKLRDLLSLKDIPTFSATEPYRRGDLVKYDGKVYRFKQSHLGTWSSGEAEPMNAKRFAQPLSIEKSSILNIVNEIIQ